MRPFTPCCRPIRRGILGADRRFVCRRVLCGRGAFHDAQNAACVRPPTEVALLLRVLMQPHSVCVKLDDQLIDAFDLRRVSRRTQQREVALNPFVYFYARLAHALMPDHNLLTTWPLPQLGLTRWSTARFSSQARQGAWRVAVGGRRTVPSALVRLTLGFPWSGQPFPATKIPATKMRSSSLFKIEHVRIEPHFPLVVPLKKWNFGFIAIKCAPQPETGMRGDSWLERKSRLLILLIGLLLATAALLATLAALLILFIVLALILRHFKLHGF